MTDADLSSLRAASSRIVNLCLGFHYCDFCPSDLSSRGNGEYHYYASNGDVFAVPALILHYVERHDYRLPEQLREGLRITRKLGWDDRAERLCEVAVDKAQDPELRLVAIADLPHWRDPRAFQALVRVLEDHELVGLVGDEIGLPWHRFWTVTSRWTWTSRTYGKRLVWHRAGGIDGIVACASGSRRRAGIGRRTKQC